MKKVLLIILVILFLLVSCVTPKPKLTKRYTSANFQPDDYWKNEAEVTATVFALNPPQSGKSEKSVVDLSDRGQAEYIKAMGKEADSVNQILNSVFTPYSKKQNLLSIDRTRVNISKRLVFSLQKNYFRPADRIEQAITTINIPDTIKFANWKHYENKYKTITPGSLTLDQTNTTTIGASISVPQVKELGDISLEHDLTRLMSETATLDKDIVQFWALLDSNKATFFQRGAISIDLSGTFLVDVSLEFQKDQTNNIHTIKFTDLFEGETAQPVVKISVEETTVYYPINYFDIDASLTLDCTLRMVKKGDKTLTESDDEVDLIVKSYSAPSNSIIVPEEDMILYVWHILFPDGRPLKWQKKNRPGFEAVKFGSFGDAEKFLHWLKLIKNKPTKINNRMIGFLDKNRSGEILIPVTSNNVSTLTIDFDKINSPKTN